KNALIRPIDLISPHGRLGGARTLGTESVVAVVRVAQEQIVLVREMIIEPRRYALLCVRTAEYVFEAGHRGQVRLHLNRLNLVCVFVVEKDEELVLGDRPTDPDARIPP